MRERVAIIGSGISGMGTAYLLSKTHDITLYEAADRLGGHTATIEVERNGEQQAIDTGFIVFNNATYPNFSRMLEQLGVSSRSIGMGFSVCNAVSNVEYAVNDLRCFFAQKKNLMSSKHWAFMREIYRFNAQVKRLAQSPVVDSEETLRSFLKKHQYSKYFVTHYLAPLTAIIWSLDEDRALDIPLHFFCSFFENHGLLHKRDILDWQAVEPNSRTYIEPLTKSFSDRIQLNSAVTKVQSEPDGVRLELANGQTEVFDQVVLAVHGDQVLPMLHDPTDEEQEVFAAFPYSEHYIQIHHDTTVMPKKRRIWNGWNIYTSEGNEKSIFTYYMNHFQNLNTEHDFLVSLDAESVVDPAAVLYETTYSHPIIDHHTLAAQKRLWRMQGGRRLWFAGAYTRHGFHEDGLWSAIRVAKGMGGDIGLFSDTYTE